MKKKCRTNDALVWVEIAILIALAVSTLFWLGGCATAVKSGAPITTLCILDFEKEMCWVNKGEGKGFTFKAIRESQITCYQGKNECWYAVDGSGLRRLINK